MSLLSRVTDFGAGIVQLVSLHYSGGLQSGGLLCLTTAFGYGIVYSGGRGDDIMYVIANSGGFTLSCNEFWTWSRALLSLLEVYTLGITLWGNGFWIWDRALWWSTFWGFNRAVWEVYNLAQRI